MAEHSVNNHTPNDDQLIEEPMMFPYLLTLDADTMLTTEETSEEMTPVKETVRHPVESMTEPTLLIVKGAINTSRSDSVPNLTTDNTTTTTFATTTTPIDAPTTSNIGTEVVHFLKENLNSFRNQLTEARGDIIELRQIAYQSERRAHDCELRMLTMENSLRQLMLLHPTIQNANILADSPTSQLTQHSEHTEEDIETRMMNPKRNLEEIPIDNSTQPQAKRVKTVNTYKGKQPFCSSCNRHHRGSCITPCSRCKAFGHQVKDCKFPPMGTDSKALKVCFKCGTAGHFKINCSLLTDESGNNEENNSHEEVLVNNGSEIKFDPNNTAKSRFYVLGAKGNYSEQTHSFIGSLTISVETPQNF